MRSHLVVHLVNYAAPKPTRPLQVELGAAWRERRAARLLAPDAAERTLAVRRDGARAVVDVPPLDVYGIVVIE